MKSILRLGSLSLLALGACSVASTEEASTSGAAVTAPAALAASAPGTLHPTGAIPNSAAVTAAHLTVATPPAGTLPSSVDLSARIGAPGDQGQESSCVGWAVGYATKTLHETEEVGWSPSSQNHEFSPSWIYNQINGGSDGGSNFGDAMNLIISSGADDLASFPYVAGDYTSQPDANSRRRAARFKAKSWASIAVDATSIKNVLAGGNAVITGINVLPDFDAMSPTNDTYDNDSGNSRGYHAIAIIGYDDSRQAFRFINSWGTSWGVQGYGWIAYSFITDAKLGMETMVLTDGANGRNAGVGVYRPTGTKFNAGTTDQWLLRNSATPGTQDSLFAYGGPGDLPVVGDWTRSNRVTVGVFRPTGTEFNQGTTDQWILSNSDTGSTAMPLFAFGAPGDVPVVGDWNGDGTATVGVFRPAGAPFNSSPGNTSGMWILSNSATGTTADYVFYYGGPGDLPVVGDWDGNGTTTIGVFRPTGTQFNQSTVDQWILSNVNAGGGATSNFSFGAPGDLPIVGDWDGNGTTTVGVFRLAGAQFNSSPGNSSDMWILSDSATGVTADYTFYYGGPGDLPIAGDWLHHS